MWTCSIWGRMNYREFFVLVFVDLIRFLMLFFHSFTISCRILIWNICALNKDFHFRLERFKFWFWSFFSTQKLNLCSKSMIKCLHWKFMFMFFTFVACIFDFMLTHICALKIKFNKKKTKKRKSFSWVWSFKGKSHAYLKF